MATTSASRRLPAMWHDARDGDSGLDHFCLIQAGGLLTECNLMAVGREVWLDAANG